MIKMINRLCDIQTAFSGLIVSKLSRIENLMNKKYEGGKYKNESKNIRNSWKFSDNTVNGKYREPDNDKFTVLVNGICR